MKEIIDILKKHRYMLNRHGTGTDVNHYVIYEVSFDRIAKEIEAITYPREFVEWLVFKMHGNYSPKFELHKYWNGTINEWRATFRKFMGLAWEDITIDELFDYWLNNVKSEA